MERRVLAFVATLALLLAVFPAWGFEGFGTQTRGGLDGRVIPVTTIADSGPGSLRDALLERGPRLIVFEVGGRIDLKSDLRVRDPHVTVAGQTAPSPGITLAGGGLRISTHDVVVQHLRIRVGSEPGDTPLDDRDGIVILGQRDGSRPVHNVVIDHCSVSWAVDEGISTWFSPVHDVTIRNSIVSEMLNDAGHPKGEHGYGLLVGDGSRRVSVIGNLFAHNTRRNPAAGQGTTTLIANNLIYDAAHNAIHFYGGPEPFMSSVVGNLVLPGPSNREADAIHFQRRFHPASRVFLEGNRGPRGTDAADLLGADEPERMKEPLAAQPPVPFDGLVLVPAERLPDTLLPRVGARPKDRDAIDRRIVAQVRSGGGRTIDHPRDVGGWPRPLPTWRPLSPPADPAHNERWLARYTAEVQ
jgi:hypothetical protein